MGSQHHHCCTRRNYQPRFGGTPELTCLFDVLAVDGMYPPPQPSPHRHTPARKNPLLYIKQSLIRGLRPGLLVSVLFFAIGCASSANASNFPVPRMFQGTRTAIAHVGFSPTVVATGREYATIKSMHILERPYRPFHFYGNSIRRRYYRQQLR